MVIHQRARNGDDKHLFAFLDRGSWHPMAMRTQTWFAFMVRGYDQLAIVFGRPHHHAPLAVNVITIAAKPTAYTKQLIG